MRVDLSVSNYVLFDLYPSDLQKAVKPQVHGVDFWRLLIGERWGTQTLTEDDLSTSTKYVSALDGFPYGRLHHIVSSKLFYRLLPSSIQDLWTIAVCTFEDVPFSEENFYSPIKKQVLSSCIADALKELRDSEAAYIQLQRCSNSIVRMTLSFDAMQDDGAFRSQVHKQLMARSQPIEFTYNVSTYQSMQYDFQRVLKFCTAESKLTSTVELKVFENENVTKKQYDERAPFSDNLTVSQRKIIGELLEEDLVRRLVSDKDKVLFKCSYTSNDMESLATFSQSTLRQFDAIASSFEHIHLYAKKINSILYTLPSGGFTCFLNKELSGGGAGGEVVALNSERINLFEWHACFTSPKLSVDHGSAITRQMIISFMKAAEHSFSDVKITLSYDASSLSTLRLFKEATDRQLYALEQRPSFDIGQRQSLEEFCSDSISFFGLNDCLPDKILVLQVEDWHDIDKVISVYMHTISPSWWSVLRKSLKQYIENPTSTVLMAPTLLHDQAS